MGKWVLAAAVGLLLATGGKAAAAAVFMLALVGIAVWAFGSGGSPRAAMGRSVQVRGHAHTHPGGSAHRAARHEAGHAAAARGVGGKVRSARVFTDGTGLVQATVPNARAAVIFLLAGQIAHGSSEGASADNAAVKKTLREFPAKERSAVLADAKTEARRIVRQRSGEIARDTRKLNERGRL